jgi:hypothetical protein
MAISLIILSTLLLLIVLALVWQMSGQTEFERIPHDQIEFEHDLN